MHTKIGKIIFKYDVELGRRFPNSTFCIPSFSSYLILLTGCFLLLSSCGKDDVHNTPHPDKGAVLVTTDWTERSLDALIPDSYQLRIGEAEQTVSGETNAFNSLFLPGKQDLLIYNKPEGMTIGGTVATVNTLAGDTLEPLPGYLYAAYRELAIVEDDTLKVTVAMQQLNRNLTLSLQLNPGDEQRIGSTRATLTGVASAVDLHTAALTATSGKIVVPTFRLATIDTQRRAGSQPALLATVRLLGVMSSEPQLLTVTVVLTDGTVHTVTTDLTGSLKDFSSNMIEPLILDAVLELPTTTEASATISGWDIIDNGSITVK